MNLWPFCLCQKAEDWPLVFDTHYLCDTCVFASRLVSSYRILDNKADIFPDVFVALPCIPRCFPFALLIIACIYTFVFQTGARRFFSGLRTRSMLSLDLCHTIDHKLALLLDWYIDPPPPPPHTHTHTHTYTSEEQVRLFSSYYCHLLSCIYSAHCFIGSITVSPYPFWI